MKILLAEDDLNLGKLLSMLLKKQNILTTWVQDGQEAYNKVYTDGYDVLVLDWMMPRLSGVQLCSRLRDEDYQGKILLLTAKDTVADKVQGLNAGADDYLVKPFEFAELMARLRALGRRSSQKLQQDTTEVGRLTLDRISKQLKKGEQDVQLSPREFQIFDLLVQNIGIVVPRDIILDRIWGLETEVSSNNIDSYVKLIRKKLEQADGGVQINTIRGVGYKLEAE